MATHESLVKVRDNLLKEMDLYEPSVAEVLDKKRYEVVKSLFYHHSPVVNQHENFNHLLEEHIHRIIKEGNEITSLVKPGSYKIVFGSLTIQDHPTKEDDKILFPREAEHCSLDYEVKVYVAAEITVGEKTKKHNLIYLCSIQVMVGSKWCSLSTIPKSRYASVGEDPLEDGGYFIVGGVRKFITAQERSSFNGIYIFNQKKKYEFHAEIRNSATSGSRTSNVNIGYNSDRFYVHIGDHQNPIPLGLVFKALGVVTEDEILNLISIDKDMKIVNLLMYSLEDTFGCKTQLAAQTNIMELIYKEAFHYNNKESSVTNNKKKKEWETYAKEKIDDLFKKEFFSRQGVTGGLLIKKAVYLGEAVKRLALTKLGRRNITDRDDFGSKCLDGPGDCIANKIYTSFTQAKSNCVRACDDAIIKGGSFSGPLKYFKFNNMVTNCLKTGNWSDLRRSGVGKEKTGVSNQFEINNYQGEHASLAETSASISTEGTLSKARHGHGSHDGIICPWQTPEGKNVGLKKGLSIGAKITIGENPQVIISILKNMDPEEYKLYFIVEGFTLEDLSFNDELEIDEETEDDSKPSITDTKIIVNGNWIALVRYRDKFVTHLRQMRRQRKINADISIAYFHLDNEIIISTEIGRPMNPLLIVNKKGKVKLTLEHIEHLKNENNLHKLKEKIAELIQIGCAQDLMDLMYLKYEEFLQKPRLKWEDLIDQGIVEYLDSKEKENTLLETHIEDIRPGKTTHVLIHPCLNIGYAASTIPLPGHNQAPRNSYQSAHMKQVIGWPGLNCFASDMNGTTSHITPYSQKPLVASRVARDRLLVDERPASTNTVVAITPHFGFNQEDSQVINKSAKERGYGMDLHFSKFHAVIDTSKRIYLEVPTNNIQAVQAKDWLEHLDEDGIPIKGAKIKKGYPVIPLVKIVSVSENEEGKVIAKKEDISLLFKSDEEGQIDQVQIGATEENYMYIRVRVVSIRYPEEGDKFASRHGQKGTCGLIQQQVDLPFTAAGISPDMCITPQCIPSRMTIGHMIEMLMGKAIAVKVDPELKKKPIIVRVKRKNGTRQFRKVNQLSMEDMGDGTPYNREFSLDYFTQALEQAGYNPTGKEVMYDGATGEMINRPIYIGVISYQRLKHMIADKWHARMNGARTRLFRQASEGRNKAGGLRFGEINFRSQCVCKYVLVYAW